MMTEDDRDAAASEDPSEPTTSLPDVIAETITAAATGIPPQVQRNLFKALGRVFLAGAEWPAKYLEGKARIASARSGVEVAKYEAEASDLKSRQKARELIYRDSAKAAAALFKDPEQALRALDFHAAEVVRDQTVREDVTLIAAEELGKVPPEADCSSEIDGDWLYSFFKEAAKRDRDEYKLMFGRILAGEIKAPGTFSISTVEVLARLNTATAEVFQNACNISTDVFGTVKIISEPFARAGTNGLTPFGVSYDQLARLVEGGLLRAELNEHTTLPTEVVDNGIMMKHAGSDAFIVRAKTQDGSQIASPLSLQGPTFTVAGKELRRVVTMVPCEAYVNALAKWLASQQIEMYRDLQKVGDQLRGKKVEVE